MNRISHCEVCAEPLVKNQRRFCSRACWREGWHGEGNPQWRGDNATTGNKRGRAQRKYPLGDCERCGASATDRHHVDGDPGNNRIGNVMLLCRRCHMHLDGRLAAIRSLTRQPDPLRPCVECRKSCKPNARGLCNACYLRAWRKGCVGLKHRKGVPQ